MVEKGFSALAVMAQSWENFLSEVFEQNEYSEQWASGRAAIARAFSSLLQHAWLATMHPMVRQQLRFSIYMVLVSSCVWRSYY